MSEVNRQIIDIEPILAAIQQFNNSTIQQFNNSTIQQFNQIDLSNIILRENGQDIEIRDAIESWKFTGLNNRDFVIMRYWEEINHDN